jgi:hypothetical protein
MSRALVIASAYILLTASPAFAQARAVVRDLLAQSFEIKAAWLGVIVLQKGKEACVCQLEPDGPCMPLH